jgi:hypothetical protein
VIPYAPLALEHCDVTPRPRERAPQQPDDACRGDEYLELDLLRIGALSSA